LSGAPGATSTASGGGPPAYLSVCAIYRDEAPYLREWVEFHRLVGIERFFLYNNLSVDDHLEALTPRIEDGTVVQTEWPMSPGQRGAYDHCLQERRDQSRWIAFLDIDEFLFSPTGRPVPEILVDYEQWPGVGVNRLRFGTSGHSVRPDGLVIENYVRRARLGRCLVKSIVDPRRTSRARTSHVFEYVDGVAVDENGKPLVPDQSATADSLTGDAYTDPFTVSRLRINHYQTRSEQEFRRKARGLKADTGVPRETPFALERTLRNFNAEKDETILSYLPALQSAMEPQQSLAGDG
jgi:Glycosyltransferase family 92